MPFALEYLALEANLKHNRVYSHRQTAHGEPVRKNPVIGNKHTSARPLITSPGDSLAGEELPLVRLPRTFFVEDPTNTGPAIAELSNTYTGRATHGCSL